MDSKVSAVADVPAAVGAITAATDPQRLGTSITATAPFTDPGKLDRHSALWSWDDTTTSSGAMSEVNGRGWLTGTHTYAGAGVYTLRVTVTHTVGAPGSNAYHYHVTYDPNGAFVTGGGWITCPLPAWEGGRGSGPGNSLRRLGVPLQIPRPVVPAQRAFRRASQRFEVPVPDQRELHAIVAVRYGRARHRPVPVVLRVILK